jgi:hypothetical protein
VTSPPQKVEESGTKHGKDKALILNGALTHWVNQYFWVSLSFSVCFVYSVVGHFCFKVEPQKTQSFTEGRGS